LQREFPNEVMSDNSAAMVSTPFLSSTILMLREIGHGMEVLMVTRHHKVDFATGALVFPGGKVNSGDQDPRVHGRCSGIVGCSHYEIALRVAAIREAFEESGLLLARKRGATRLIDAHQATELGPRYRKRLDSGEMGIADMLEAEDLELACEELVPFAHWITPTFLPKRFDTYFYLAVAPAEQVALHDGKETVESVWLTPADALAQTESGQRTMVIATTMNVRRLGASASIADAVRAAQRQPIVTVLPELILGSNGRALRIPAEAGYGATEIPL
jgi:8-oxo-dGTP pyrophosphatase MutT (NUDIX family)